MASELPKWARDRITESTTGCWIWNGASQSGGYGRAWLGRREYQPAHRAVYEALVGHIPTGLVLDHVCHNLDTDCPGGECVHRKCVNPLHLEPVTQKVNMSRAPRSVAFRNGSKTSCVNGHEFTPENTYRRKDRKNIRECRTCRIEVSARFHANRKSKSWQVQ